MANQIPLIVNAGAGQIQQLATGDNLSVTANVVTGNILAGGYFYANGQPFSGGSGSGNTTWANIGNINNSYGPTQIAIGLQAGASQGTSAIAIGEMAGSTGQRAGGVAVGATAGSTNQGNNAVAIGGVAGYNNQGANAIAIGFGAGQSNQPNSTVILNATGSAFNGVSGQQNSFYVPTVRGNATGNALYYNPGTGEITFGATSGGGNTMPGGSNTQIQFNANGVFGGSDNFIFDGNNVIISGASFVANPGAYILDVYGANAYIGSLVDGGVSIANATTNINTNATYITGANTVIGDIATAGGFYFEANTELVSIGQVAVQTITLGAGGIQIAGTGGVQIEGASGAEVTLGGGTSGQVTVSSAINSSNTITATSYYGDGSTLTGLYGNTNVANYLPTYSGVVNGGSFSLADAGNLTYSSIQQNQNPPYGSEAYGIELLTTTDDANVFSSISAGPDYVSLKSTNAGNANVVLQGGYGITLSTSNATGGAIKNWTFTAAGEALYPGNISTSGNVYATNIVAEASFNIQSSNFNAIVGNRYGVDTTSNPVTATLTAFPITGTAVFFADAGGAFATNNFTINPVGQTIMGSSGNYVVNTNNNSFGLFWNGTTWRTYSNV